MCGIFGYLGQKTNASEIVLEGLKRLDYRGYDSWGIAVQKQESGSNNQGKIFIKKHTGKIQDVRLNSEFLTLNSTTAIGHTRWATTGSVTLANAHPHYATNKSFVLAQNGIVENFVELKEALIKKGYTFTSETDTEVIVRLIEEKLKKTKDMQQAIRAAFGELTGRNTIIILTHEGQIFAARNGSPLVLGYNDKTQEIYLSSDTLSFAPYANKCLVIENGQMIHVSKPVIARSQKGDEAIPFMELTEINTDKPLPYKLEKVTISSHTIDKGKYEHYMIKEIFDTPDVIRTISKQDSAPYQALAKAIKKARRVYTIGSGTAGIAAAQTAFYLRSIAQIPAISLIGADAREYYPLFTKDDLIIAPSQSGETADVLEVLEIAQKKEIKIASYVNMPGSMMTRMSDYPFMAEAGAEICVMSTKVFSSQINWGYLLAKTVAGQGPDGRKELKKLAKQMHTYLEEKKTHTAIRKLAKHLMHKKDIFLLGKSQNLQIVNEGMVKIIEGAYIHAHAIPAGDLKHYAITLMEKGMPVIVALSEDETKAEVMNAVSEIRARGAEVIGISAQAESFDQYLPVPDTGETSALMHIIPLQLLSYYLSLELGNNIDKPRNIAKSVTVK